MARHCTAASSSLPDNIYFSHRKTSALQALDAARSIISSSRNLAMLTTFGATNTSGLAARLVGTKFLDDDGVPVGRPNSKEDSTNKTPNLRLGLITTNPQTRKVQQLTADDRILLTFADTNKEGYVVMHGKATLEKDQDSRKAIWRSMCRPGSRIDEMMRGVYPGGADGKNFMPILIVINRIELIYHDLPSRSAAVADHPDGWKPLVLVYHGDEFNDADGYWKVEADDGRLIVQR